MISNPSKLLNERSIIFTSFVICFVLSLLAGSRKPNGCGWKTKTNTVKRFLGNMNQLYLLFGICVKSVNNRWTFFLIFLYAKPWRQEFYHYKLVVNMIFIHVMKTIDWYMHVYSCVKMWGNQERNLR